MQFLEGHYTQFPDLITKTFGCCREGVNPLSGSYFSFCYLLWRIFLNFCSSLGHRDAHRNKSVRTQRCLAVVPPTEPPAALDSSFPDLSLYWYPVSCWTPWSFHELSFKPCLCTVCQIIVLMSVYCPLLILLLCVLIYHYSDTNLWLPIHHPLVITLHFKSDTFDYQLWLDLQLHFCLLLYCYRYMCTKPSVL